MELGLRLKRAVVPEAYNSLDSGTSQTLWQGQRPLPFKGLPER